MQSLLIIGYVWPEPTATAAGSRMLQIIEQFQLSNYKITFVSTAQKQTSAFDLSTLGVATFRITLNDSSFDEFVKELTPSVVLFDRFMIEEQFGWRVLEECPNAVRILDSEDLHFLRKARHEAVKQQKELPTEVLHTDEAKREIASIYRCDATLTISEFEINYLQEIYKIPKDLLWYFPFLIEEDQALNIDFSERTDFMFIGNFMHAPNWDAVLYLKKQLWPMLKKELPNASLKIYGAYASDKVFQLHNKKEGFLIMGRAPSVKEAMEQARVCLVPIRFGAGLKGKLIDAMQYNTPFVTSTIGAEGMFGAIDFENSIAISDKDFVAKAIRLYQNTELSTQMILKGKEVLRTRFSKDKYRVTFQEKLTYLHGNIEALRADNFVGAMLQHHSLKSTKYLSKWIEEKNKH